MQLLIYTAIIAEILALKEIIKRRYTQTVYTLNPGKPPQIHRGQWQDLRFNADRWRINTKIKGIVFTADWAYHAAVFMPVVQMQMLHAVYTMHLFLFLFRRQTHFLRIIIYLIKKNIARRILQKKVISSHSHYRRIDWNLI